MQLINIGGNSVIADSQILLISSSDSAPMKRILKQAKMENRLIDTTEGKKIRSVIITISGTIIRSSVSVDTLQKRNNGLHKNLTEENL